MSSEGAPPSDPFPPGGLSDERVSKRVNLTQEIAVARSIPQRRETAMERLVNAIPRQGIQRISWPEVLRVRELQPRPVSTQLSAASARPPMRSHLVGPLQVPGLALPGAAHPGVVIGAQKVDNARRAAGTAVPDRLDILGQRPLAANAPSRPIRILHIPHAPRAGPVRPGPEADTTRAARPSAEASPGYRVPGHGSRRRLG